MGRNDPGGSKKAKFSKSSNLSKNSAKSKGSSRLFQRRSFHLKRTPYEKVIALCCIDKTGKFGTMGVPRGTTGRVTRGIDTVGKDDVAVVQAYMWQYSPIKMRHVSLRR